MTDRWQLDCQDLEVFRKIMYASDMGLVGTHTF
jgi:hypothetical protein